MKELVCLTIDNFSKFGKHSSDVFFVGDLKWWIYIYPKGNGNNEKYLSMYLEVADSSKLPSGWTQHAKFSFTVVDQLQSRKSFTRVARHKFSASSLSWGFTSFMPLSELHDPSKGGIVNDICIIEAEVELSKVVKIVEGQGTGTLANKMQEGKSQGPSNACTNPTDSTVDQSIVKENEEVRSAQVGNLMDFRGLVKIEKAFVPLLDEVCSWHPSLIECQLKRSRMFTECSFTALGRVLHFLKTEKVKDMTNDAHEHLQLLWEELETFRFDLAWLEPHVQSALGMKKFVKRAEQVQKMRERVAALEIETKRLRAEVDLQAAKREFAKAEEGFGETNMDSELGYGGH